MKIISIVLISIVLGIAAGLATATWRIGPVDRPDAQVQQRQAAGEEGDVPQAEIDQTEFNFGTMDVSAEGEHTFRIRNIGSAPLELTAGGTSCGCTVSELQQSTLAPGESTDVIVTWQADKGAGPYRQTATIHTNDPRRPRIELTVSGEVVQSLRAVPDSLHFGRMAGDEPVRGEATLLCLVPRPMEIVGYEMANHRLAPFFEVSHEPIPLQEAEHPEAHGAVRVGVRVKPGLPPGAFRQTIRLRTNLPDVPPFPLDVRGRVAGDISIVGIGPGWDADHNLLRLGNVPADRGARRTLLLVVRGEHRERVEFRVERVTPDWLDVALGRRRTLASGVISQTPLTIAVPEGSPSAVHLGSEQGKLGEVRLTTDHPTMPELRIRVRFAVIGGG